MLIQQVSCPPLRVASLRVFLWIQRRSAAVVNKAAVRISDLSDGGPPCAPRVFVKIGARRIDDRHHWKPIDIERVERFGAEIVVGTNGGRGDCFGRSAPGS